ncbi:unnamed protein product [Pleuronectes platessa]|uniref:Uncharacterized protein n=1 Tax=Pleuronectes platessa TaxID=8262 RepID=A0A9N7UJ73_PLEPL|nr:unnamed protein product [Pleuronectes platessa]
MTSEGVWWLKEPQSVDPQGLWRISLACPQAALWGTSPLVHWEHRLMSRWLRVVKGGPRCEPPHAAISSRCHSDDSWRVITSMQERGKRRPRLITVHKGRSPKQARTLFTEALGGPYLMRGRKGTSRATEVRMWWQQPQPSMSSAMVSSSSLAILRCSHARWDMWCLLQGQGLA